MQKSVHLLIVEDDPDDVDLLESALRDNQVEFQNTVIAQGDKVLPWLHMCKKFPNAIILDLNLPKMHGREVLVQIKKTSTFQHIPVIILTTSSSTSEQEFCLQEGAHKFLSKPVTLEAFNFIVKEILSVIEQP